MTAETTWHADAAVLARYATGGLDDAARWSVESHVTACAECRRLVARAADTSEPERLAQIWGAVVDRVDVPIRGPIERMLGWLGVPDALARLLAATSSLTLSWLLAVAAVVAASVAVSWGISSGGTANGGPFLALMPLVPLAGVAAAFGPGVDPTYEIGLAAPLRSGRLLLVRAVAVIVASFVVAGVGAMALPFFDWRIAAWILPSLATTTVMLALATWVTPLWAAGGVATAWIAMIGVTELRAAAPMASFGARGQVLALVVLTTGVAVATLRRQRFDMRSRP